MSYKTLRWIALVGLCVVSVPRTARSDTVMVAGGARLTTARPNFASSKIITGGGKTHLTYQFTFKAAFDVSGVTIRMEDDAGKQITVGPDKGITGVHLTPTAGSRKGATPAGRPSATATHTCKRDIPAGKTFTVDVKAKATAGAVRFSLSFSTSPPAGSTRCTQLADVEAGEVMVARPFLPGTAGLCLRVTNNTKDAIGFARFSLLGSTPDIAAVRVPDRSVDMDGTTAFTLTGDKLGVGETVQLFIFFETAASSPGALVARFARS